MRELQIVPCLCAITVHTGQEDFPRAQHFDVLCPFYRIKPRGLTSPMSKDLPRCRSILPPLGINGDHNTLTAKRFRSLTNKRRLSHRCSINRDLICPGAEQISYLGNGG